MDERQSTSMWNSVVESPAAEKRHASPLSERSLKPFLLCTCLAIWSIWSLLLESSKIAQYRVATDINNFINAAYNPATMSIFISEETESRAASVPNIQESAKEFLYPLPFSQWLEDVDTSNAKCGVYKCAFHSMTNQRLVVETETETQLFDDNPKRYGYLVSQEYIDHDLEVAQKSWEKANELSEKFSIQHLLLAPPKMNSITKAYAKKLNANSTASTIDGDRPKFGSAPFAGTKKKKLIVQPIQLVPEGSLFFGCYEKKYKQSLIELREYVSKVNQTSLSGLELEKFEDQLHHDFDATMRMLNSNEGACMRWDFQVFFDPNTGSIYHFDIERCFEGEFKPAFQCNYKLKEFANMLLEIRGGSKLTNITRINGKTKKTKKKKTKKKTKAIPKKKKTKRKRKSPALDSPSR